MTTKNLLVELFVEELPPKALKKLGYSFGNELAVSLSLQALASPDHASPDIEQSDIKHFASPRRLAVHLKNVRSKALDGDESIKLMPISVGFSPDGEPTPPLQKRLSALGYDGSVVNSLERRASDGQLYLNRAKEGVTLAVGLQKALEVALAKLPIPKVMTYQLADGWTSVQFVRPAHGLVALHGADIVPVSALGLEAGRTTQGHRFEAKTPTLEIRDADSYEAQMENDGAVIPSFDKRRDEIERQLGAAAAKAGAGLKPIEDEALLDEVTALVERPNVLLCQFDAEFLEVPQECLILTMKANQKYFPLLDAHGKLTNQFLVVSNIRPQDASAVVGGNERVVRPRLADAKFFYDQDRKKTLESRVLGLAKVVYHNKLGTQGERVERVAAIAKAIGLQLGGDALAMQAEAGALLAKADLLTDMVGEFPELQGIMGRYYALHDGLPGEIADAIEDHYKPRFAGDSLPRNMVGVSVALADKLETLAGLFGIGQIPTGDKDPFALRRHALGVLRMLTEKQLPLRLNELVHTGFAAFPVGLVSDAHAEVVHFLFDRLGGMMREQGYTAHEVDAVLSMRPAEIYLVPKRLEAVRAFAALPEAEALAAANKRIGNILRKEGIDTSLRQHEKMAVNAGLFKEAAETALYAALNDTAPRADAAYERGDYAASLKEWARLKQPVDAFFDNVMVNAEDPALRANRLALLAHLHAAMNRVADISRLAA
jgi:glycyl-tRNA synthetase beta chain